jgi:hypothetical protein
MSFVQTRYPLPSVTGNNGQVMPFSFAPGPGRCPVDLKRGIAGKQQTRVIRPIVQRTKLSIVPANPSLGELGSFWSSIGSAIKGVAAGFATGGPAGAAIGGGAGLVSGATNSKKSSQPAQPQQQLGPLAGVSTGTIVGVGLGFSALILVLAGMGRGR